MDFGEFAGRLMLGALALAVLFVIFNGLKKAVTGKDITKSTLANLNGVVNVLFLLGLGIGLIYIIFGDV
jgi:hypothetical protein